MIRAGSAQKLRWTLAAVALSATLPASAAASPADLSSAVGARFAPNEVLVRYAPGTGQGDRRQVRDRLDAELERRLVLPRTELLDLGPGESVTEAVAELRGDPDVAFAEPNYVYSLASTPNDTEFDNQWALHNDEGMFGVTDADIDAPEAWDTTTGDGTVTVAVVDSGVALTHEDLDDNIWASPGENGGGLESNGLDDDGNLLVDDHSGWDFVQDDNDPTDGEGHGTHVAGILGAEGDNGTGIAGVNWDVQLMPLRACDSLGSCLSSNVADAFVYAGASGADVVNASLSGTGSSLAQQAAIAAAPDTLFVAAAGNEGSDNELVPRFPCNYTSQNLVCVAATDGRDQRAAYSNFGASAVDLAAPGGGSPMGTIRSTYMAEPMSQTFFGPNLPNEWVTGGTPDSWDWTDEVSQLQGGKLTDSPGADYADATDNFARFGPVNLSADSDCQLRYELELDVPDPGDHLQVQASSNDVSYTTIQDWTGVGEAALTPSISAFDNEPTVFIRFRLEADGDANVGDGAHVDNVRVRCGSGPGGYHSLQGTSMAAPHVSGAAALMLAHNPGAEVADLRQWLTDGVDLRSGLNGVVSSGGRLNLARSLAGAGGADIDRPDTSIVTGPATTSKSTSATFSFTADEPASGFSCSLNGAAFSACPSPRTITDLAVGQHGFSVRATDLAGNVDGTPASYAFTVEQSTGAGNCAKLRKKLKRAKSKPQRRNLRKKIKKRCTKLGL